MSLSQKSTIKVNTETERTPGRTAIPLKLLAKSLSRSPGHEKTNKSNFSPQEY